MKTFLSVTLFGAMIVVGTLVWGLARHRHHRDASESQEPVEESGPPGEVVARQPAAPRLPRRPPSFMSAKRPPPSPPAVLEEPPEMTRVRIGAFEAEARDPIWAGAMEEALARRFDPGSVPAWLAAMNLESMECHAHSCRMVVSYPAELSKVASELAVARGAAARTPLEHLIRETGPVAGATSVISTETTGDPGGSPSVKVTAVLDFKPDESNPAVYPDWVSSHRPPPDPLGPRQD